MVKVGKRPRDAGDAEAAIGQPAFIDEHQTQDLRNADRGHGKVVALEAHTDPGNRPAGHARNNRRSNEADRNGHGKAAKVPAGGRRRQDRGGIGSDAVETGNPGIEQPAHAPLHIERKTEQRVDAAQDQQADNVEKETGQFH